MGTEPTSVLGQLSVVNSDSDLACDIQGELRSSFQSMKLQTLCHMCQSTLFVLSHGTGATDQLLHRSTQIFSIHKSIEHGSYLDITV